MRNGFQEAVKRTTAANRKRGKRWPFLSPTLSHSFPYDPNFATCCLYNNRFKTPHTGLSSYSGGGIRTRDLRVMSPTSYLAAPPRGGLLMLARWGWWRAGVCGAWGLDCAGVFDGRGALEWPGG